MKNTSVCLCFEIEKTEEDFINSIGKVIEKEEKLLSVPNPEQIAKIVYAYSILEHMSEVTDAKISYTLNKPFKGMGCITVTGKNLSFKSANFIIASELASNVDIFPKTNGTVQIDFTFHELTKIIK